MEKDPSFTKYYDSYAKAPYLYSESKQEFYTYEDKRSLGEKVGYVKEHNLGGIIIWELSADAPASSEDALLNVIYEGFYPDGIHAGESNVTVDDNGDTGSSDDSVTDNENDNTDSGDDNTATSVTAWSSTQVYVEGDLVSYEGETYRAKWWTQGDIPGADEWGPWELTDATAADDGSDINEDVGMDSGNENDNNATDTTDNGDTTGDTGVDNGTWRADTIYTGGEVVVYNGKKYQAQWWTQGDVPGSEEWGPWKEVADTTPVDDPTPDPLPTDDNTTDTSDGASTDDGIVASGGTVSLSALQETEAALTDTPLMALTKASIRTLDNAEVEQIAPLRAENPANVKRVESMVSEADWEYLFADRSPEYTYENFLKAVGKFPAFCGDYDDGRDAEAICRKSLATMFAHFPQETGGHNPASNVPEWRQGLVYVREMGWDETMRGGYNAECSLDTWQGQAFPCGTFEDGSFKSYFGRGAKQLSYNYNYGAFSEAMTGDVHTLLDHPELVADTWYNLASAVFFFVYPQPPKPSMLFVVDGTWQPNESDVANGLVAGFGVTTNIINGGVECGGASEHEQSLNRIAYYREFANYLDVPIAEDEVLGCANMQQFTSDSAAALPIYWEEDWSWNANSSDGRSYSCQLVNYQTPYSAFREGDYVKCVEEKFDVTAE
jgi:chitodextrinase